MKILAIETSCDDTGVAILEIRGDKKPVFNVLSNIVSSQLIHKNYGGVFPIMAKREHQINLPIVLEQALKESKLLIPNSQFPLAHKTSRRLISDEKIKILKKILEKENTLFESVKEFLEKYKKPSVDFIAVTVGPGLEPCLWVGVNFAKALSYFWGIPVIPVNHIEAHILVNFLENPKREFPAISLVVSGGHTQLILVKGIGKYKIIGETRDDAAGECFDKAARILELGYPGGPIISKIASETRSRITIRDRVSDGFITLPRPMMYSKDYDFSFSGLKTAVLYRVRDEGAFAKASAVRGKFIQEMCFAIQDAICDVLIKKTINAAKDFKAKSIILGGGVSANQELRKQLKERIAKEIPNTKYLIPDTALSTDNGLMIAVAGYFNKTKILDWKKIKVDANLRINP
ncbi:MAG: hypothetical protein A3D34_00420 [Candidatus Staskawiczbacteria bacterium RIFCSPHIGHO2_02_FULL_33_16]|uniref:tRNA N6-adenosine threonylcarbamoyltransferase n=1 Tax=Candidatus Staskawiczbacteria bacterium RIFCSPHIGHO2_02_FULL_33_16 TaxID=1802204 RepID=A0A1G2HXF7_9BACT|nr:MAG: hypothetical protein A3D34_00420 [Candidatus Staskawiczbacteria bacterium RIFCSPHIGHO2_02_FULL_33_16]OGZ70917.1 MAG: hypothetical protein A2980_02770 [Candidatus Staskawiczbacteria bacterium RIFCSPLOWO2_01_FULL_33_13]